MSILAKLTDRETQLAEDMAAVLDQLSRVMHGLDNGNLGFAEEKAWSLLNNVEAQQRHLERAVKNVAHEPPVRPDLLRTAIAELSRTYAAGRALYPVQGGEPR